ncbi:MAG: YbbR-like domain-containing protein, partial [Sphingobacteriales bacterium]
DFTKKKKKKIPVKLISVISYQKQYNQSACVELNPKMVTLIGPEIELNKINFWPTQLLKTSKTNVNISKNISLFKPFKNNISVYPSVVKVKIPVEEFTEKILDIPIKVTNNPNYYNVKLFPNKVSIKVLVPLSRFHKLSADDFEAKVDLNLWAIYHVDKLSVKVSNYATYTRIVQVEPHQINYIIKK